VGQVEGQEVGLLVVATGRYLAGRPLDDDAAVEVGDGADPVGRNL
jgi:hypothetical protein